MLWHFAICDCLMVHGTLASGDLDLGKLSTDTESDCFNGAMTRFSVGEAHKLGLGSGARLSLLAPSTEPGLVLFVSGWGTAELGGVKLGSENAPSVLLMLDLLLAEVISPMKPV